MTSQYKCIGYILTTCSAWRAAAHFQTIGGQWFVLKTKQAKKGTSLIRVPLLWVYGGGEPASSSSPCGLGWPVGVLWLVVLGIRWAPSISATCSPASALWEAFQRWSPLPVSGAHFPLRFQWVSWTGWARRPFLGFRPWL